MRVSWNPGQAARRAVFEAWLLGVVGVVVTVVTEEITSLLLLVSMDENVDG